MALVGATFSTSLQICSMRSLVAIMPSSGEAFWRSSSLRFSSSSSYMR